MIYLVESKLYEKISEKINEKKELLPIQNDSIIIVKDTIKVLTSNHKLIIDQWCNNVSIELWDGCVPDNDQISIYLNDRLFRGNITLTNKRNRIKLPSTDQKIKLRIVALNEGDSGLNTLDFVIKNSFGEKKFVAVLRKDESFEIEFSEK
jgi:hypothetical protein